MWLLLNGWVFRQGSDLGLDGCEDAKDLGLRSFQIVHRADPERHGWDFELGTPGEHLVELLGAEIVGCARIDEAVFAGVASVTIKDDTDVTRRRARADFTS